MLTIHLKPNARFVALGVGCTFVLLLLLARPSTPSLRLPEGLFSTPRRRASCAPADYASGNWQLRTPARHAANVTRMSEPADAYTFSGFEGCASNRELRWHLASDNPDHYDRFPAAHDYEWVPGSECRDLAPWDPERMVRDLVEQGGWLLLGDSVSENHFFSISCLLYPHVRATPNYTEGESFDRAWPQHLYLSPTSPLLTRTHDRLILPPNFNITSTPLVSFRRNDVLMSQDELVALWPRARGFIEGKKLFSDETAWFISPSEYMSWFVAPRPEGAGYSTLVVSTAGHWTTTLFRGFRDDQKAETGYGIDGVQEFFQLAMTEWANVVQKWLDRADKEQAAAGAASRMGVTRRQVIVRAYLPGHENCHQQRSPWTKYQVPHSYNWGYIAGFNKLLENVVSAKPDIHYAGIDRPGLLRPDTHSTQDCLHVMTGAGVMEGWTHYIWHFVTRELVGRIR